MASGAAINMTSEKRVGDVTLVLTFVMGGARDVGTRRERIFQT